MREQLVGLLCAFFLMPVLQAQKQPVHFFQWKIAGSLPDLKDSRPALGVAGPVAGMHDQKLIVAGGANFPDSMPWAGGKKKYYDEVYVFNRTDDSVLILATARLPFPVAYSAICSTARGIFSAGGENENGLLKKTFLITWDAVGEKIVVNNLPDLPVAVTNANAACSGNVVYVAGGETTDGVSNQLLSLDLNFPATGWKSLPAVPVNVSHAAFVVQSNGKDSLLYLVGGRKKTPGGISELYRSVYSFDPKRGKWSAKKSLPWALSAGTGIAHGKQKIFLFGGDKGKVFHQAEKLIVAAGAEQDEKKKQHQNLQRIKVQSQHPGFDRTILQYNSITDEWSPAGCVPFDVPVTTVAILSGEDIIIPSGEIKAGIRTPRILMAKFLMGR